MNIKQIIQPPDDINRYTMATPARVALIIDLAYKALALDGDYVECGVCNGGSAAVLAHFAGSTRGKLTWLFDSFEGLPPVTKEDTPAQGGRVTAQSCVGQCKGNVETVKYILELAGADMQRVNIVKGWFKDTFPVTPVDRICMLNLDSDWYESEKLCLETFYDKLSIGGYIYFDDFHYWPGCQTAAREFFAKRGLNPKFNTVEHSAWLQKEE